MYCNLIGSQMTGNGALLMELLQCGLKSVTIGQPNIVKQCYNITPRDIANAIGCLRDNTSLKELTIWTKTDQSEVHLTAYH